MLELGMGRMAQTSYRSVVWLKTKPFASGSHSHQKVGQRLLVLTACALFTLL